LAVMTTPLHRSACCSRGVSPVVARHHERNAIARMLPRLAANRTEQEKRRNGEKAPLGLPPFLRSSCSIFATFAFNHGRDANARKLRRSPSGIVVVRARRDVSDWRGDVHVARRLACGATSVFAFTAWGRVQGAGRRGRRPSNTTTAPQRSSAQTYP
jgi:hypothetical protein